MLYQTNSAGGIVTGGGPYGWVEPADATTTRRPTAAGSFGFHTEIGMPVVSTAESMRNLVGDEPGVADRRGVVLPRLEHQG